MQTAATIERCDSRVGIEGREAGLSLPPARQGAAQAPPSKCAGCGTRQIAICAAVPAQELARFSAAATTVRIEPGHRFMDEGEAADNFFIVTNGTAKLLKMLPDGRQQITSFVGDGDFLGLAFLTQYSYSAEAITAMRLCRFSRPRMRQLFADFPLMEKRLLASACHELVLAQEQMLLLGRKSACERLASFLVDWARKAEPATAPGGLHRQILAKLPMSRADIGDYLGMRIETVSRTLRLLKTAGVIATAPGWDIMVQDLAGLEAMSGNA